MKAYLSILSGCPLFSGLTSQEIERILGCMKLEPHFAKEGEALLREGDLMSSALILLDGRIRLSRPAFCGREEFDQIRPGGVIGLESIFLPERIGFSALADCDAVYLKLDSLPLIATCEKSCNCHNRLTANLVRQLARSAYESIDRTVHLTRRTTREKLLSYLMSESARQGSREFEIPLDRRSLAEYLAVDRSAMSSELSRMRLDGLIEYSRSHFILK